MLVLLPPSETKRPGGDGPAIDVDSLALPGLAPERQRVIDALAALSARPDDAARVLKLSAARRHEIDDNAALRTAPTLAAIDRYTGVLFDAAAEASASPPSRTWMGEHVLIHSAPFGPVGALDRIPAYRLAAGTAVPGVPPLRRLWASAVTDALHAAQPGFVLDLRSEAYAALGPVPSSVPTAYVRVVSSGPEGTVRALNHFNKRAKGDLVRSLAATAPDLCSPDDFHAWARAEGIRTEPGAGSEVRVFV